MIQFSVRDRINRSILQSFDRHCPKTMTDKFEFVGMDACLMGTVEMANIAASYARYMYGSEEMDGITRRSETIWRAIRPRTVLNLVK